jgi:hypothetical protein
MVRPVPLGVTSEQFFIVVEEADVEVFGEQRMGEFVTVEDADCSDHEEEIFVREFPWSRVPQSDDRCGHASCSP